MSTGPHDLQTFMMTCGATLTFQSAGNDFHCVFISLCHFWSTIPLLYYSVIDNLLKIICWILSLTRLCFFKFYWAVLIRIFLISCNHEREQKFKYSLYYLLDLLSIINTFYLSNVDMFFIECMIVNHWCTIIVSRGPVTVLCQLYGGLWSGRCAPHLHSGVSEGSKTSPGKAFLMCWRISYVHIYQISSRWIISLLN